MNVSLLLRFLLGHILGDFYLQSDNLSIDKRNSVRKLLSHCLVYSVCVFLFSGVWNQGLLFMTVLFLSHLAVDFSKIKLDNRIAGEHGNGEVSRETDKANWIIFAADQGLHIFVLVVLWLISQAAFPVGGLSYLREFLAAISTSRTFLTISLAYLIVGTPAGIVVAFLIRRWSEEIRLSSNREDDGLLKAGKWIGILERLFVLTFVIIGNVGAIGFLVTAKSIFRFGELKQRRTEYILIGTMLSFFIAMSVGLIVRYLLTQTDLSI